MRQRRIRPAKSVKLRKGRTVIEETHVSHAYRPWLDRKSHVTLVSRGRWWNAWPILYRRAMVFAKYPCKLKKILLQVSNYSWIDGIYSIFVCWNAFWAFIRIIVHCDRLKYVNVYLLSELFCLRRCLYMHLIWSWVKQYTVPVLLLRCPKTIQSNISSSGRGRLNVCSLLTSRNFLKAQLVNFTTTPPQFFSEKWSPTSSVIICLQRIERRLA